MSKQEQSGAEPRDTKERTEQKEMHSKDAHETTKDRKPAPSTPAKNKADK